MVNWNDQDRLKNLQDIMEAIEEVNVLVDRFIKEIRRDGGEAESPGVITGYYFGKKLSEE